MHRLLLPTLLLFLAGCQTTSTLRDTSVGAWIRLDGAQVQLEHPLWIAPHKARVFLQGGNAPADGSPYPGVAIDQYRPHCAFEILSVQHDGVTIEPDTFTITRMQDSVQPVVSAPLRGLQLAALSAGFGFGGFGGLWGYDGGSALFQGFHFYLSSARQPDVLRMSCYGAYAEPYELYPPTMGEIRAALGNVADIYR